MAVLFEMDWVLAKCRVGLNMLIHIECVLYGSGRVNLHYLTHLKMGRIQVDL